MKYKRQTGQVVVILLLVIVVALAIGLSVVGRSITEISTSSKTEDSSKAFSAAEAGIEKALQGSVPSGNLSGALSNQANATYNTRSGLPPAHMAIEYPPYGKEAYALFWLAHPNPNPASQYYTYTAGGTGRFDLYFGSPNGTNINGTVVDYVAHPEQKPAVQVQVISYNSTTGYSSWRGFYDSNTSREPPNGFQGCTSSPAAITTNYAGNTNRQFYCVATVNFTPQPAPPSTYPVLVRVRLLYSDYVHPVALQPLGSCMVGDDSCSLPPQLNIYKSTGTAGNSQRVIQVFQVKKAVPDIFGYALFSAGDLDK